MGNAIELIIVPLVTAIIGGVIVVIIEYWIIQPLHQRQGNGDDAIIQKTRDSSLEQNEYASTNIRLLEISSNDRLSVLETEDINGEYGSIQASRFYAIPLLATITLFVIIGLNSTNNNGGFNLTSFLLSESFIFSIYWTCREYLKRRLYAIISNEGIYYRKGARETKISWEDISSLTQERNEDIIIRLKDEYKTVKIPHDMKHFDKFDVSIKKHIFRKNILKLIDDYNSGISIKFYGVQVNYWGLELEREKSETIKEIDKIYWKDIRDIEISQNKIWLVTMNKSNGAIVKQVIGTPSSMPNFFIFTTLVKNIIKAYTIE